MVLAYFVDCEFSLSNPNSVTKKVLLQTQRWVELGHQVYIYSLSSSMRLHLNTRKVTLLGKNYNKKTNPVSKLVKFWSTSYKIFKDLNSVKVDAIYSRYLLYSFFIQKAFSSFPCIVEINSNDDSEYLRASIFTRVYNSLFKRLLLRKVDSFVCVTHELAKYISNYSKKRKYVIANGFNFERSATERDSFLSRVENDSPVMVFVASPGNACHGLDYLLKIAEKLPTYNFKIIGYQGAHSKNVKYYGYLSKEDLSEHLKNADVGVSALAVERHGMKEACPLKSREYLFYGLPIVGNYKDPDLSGQEFYLEVDNSDIDLMAAKIHEFTTKWLEIPNRKYLITSKANSLVSYLYKEEKRLAFISETIRNGRK